MARTLGVASTSATLANTAATASHMIPPKPMPAMIPPVAANPMGWATWLPRARNDPTRERRSGVTCRVMVVSSRLPEMMMTEPPTHAHAAMTATGAGTESAMNVATNGSVMA